MVLSPGVVSSSDHEGDHKKQASIMKKHDYSLSSDDEGLGNSGGNPDSSEAATSFKISIQESARAVAILQS